MLAVVTADFLAQLIIQIVSYSTIWFGDFRVWSTFLTILSLGVIFSVQWLEHSRIRHSNAVVLFYWSFLLIALAVKLRSLISQQLFNSSRGYFITYCMGVGFALAAFLVEWQGPKQASEYQALVGEEGAECPAEYATVFSRLTFSWMTPLMKLGYKHYLTEEDLWALQKTDTSRATGAAFDTAWTYELEHRKYPSMWLALFRAYGGPYLLAAVFKSFSDVFQFIQPQLLRLLIQFVRSHNEEGEDAEPVIKGVSIALGMFAIAVFQTAMLHQYFQGAFVTGMRIKGGLTNAIYRKAMKLSNEGRASKSTGDIVNYMAVDAQRLQDLTQFALQLFSAPLQVLLCMISLHQLVGWSMMAGVGVMVAMVPLNGIVARFMKKLQKEQMANKDKRSRLIAEIVAMMKSIKLYSWGAAFMNKLNYVRNEQELKTLRKIGAAQAIANFTWSTTPFLVSCLTFTVYVFTNSVPLTTDIIFPALTLFNLLSFPLAVFPMVISSIVEATVAISRLADYLTAEEVQPDSVIIKPAVEELGEETVKIADGTFSWNRYDKNKNVLEHITYAAHKGDLSCVVGRVGSGKSSFLQSILGDLYKVKGHVQIHGNVAYVAQQTWIMNATVKENIIFGYKFDSNFYEQTIRACALVDDLSVLPDGDETVVGERGISLSGGQKARVALARAVYSRADIFLLDDVLSAVDAHVGQHIVNEVLGPKGLLRTKTRILATNAIPVLGQADHIVMLRDGSIVEQGTLEQLLAMRGIIADLYKSYVSLFCPRIHISHLALVPFPFLLDAPSAFSIEL